jgi:carboxyl-terminal processing protease
LFLPKETVATIVVDNAATNLPFKTAYNPYALVNSEPVVIWIDERSASASEVFAGSLHDNCRAVLMGSHSFGKGLIQAVYGLKSGAGLVLTVARYTTPNGNEIQKIGLDPDIPGHVSPMAFGFSTDDTSQVDFQDVRQRLSLCKPPST